MQFLRPTKAHMLSGSYVDPGLVLSASLRDNLNIKLQAGTRVLAKSRSSSPLLSLHGNGSTSVQFEEHQAAIQSSRRWHIAAFSQMTRVSF